MASFRSCRLAPSSSPLCPSSPSSPSRACSPSTYPLLFVAPSLALRVDRYVLDPHPCPSSSSQSFPKTCAPIFQFRFVTTLPRVLGEDVGGAKTAGIGCDALIRSFALPHQMREPPAIVGCRRFAPLLPRCPCASATRGSRFTHNDDISRPDDTRSVPRQSSSSARCVTASDALAWEARVAGLRRRGIG